jgi:putative transposase
MNCPSCLSVTTKQQSKKTSLGYRAFRCSVCHHTFNERTNTPRHMHSYQEALATAEEAIRLAPHDPDN